MQGITLSKISDNVMNFFGSIVEKADKQVTFVKRTSKLTAKLFVETLVMSCFADCEISLERMCFLLKQQGVKMSKQGLHQRFNEKSVELMQFLFQESLVQFKTEKQEVIDLLNQFSSVRITDSTGLSLPSNLKHLYKGMGGSSSEAGIKLQSTFDYIKGQLTEVKMTEGRRNDQSFDEHLNFIGNYPGILRHVG